MTGGPATTTSSGWWSATSTTGRRSSSTRRAASCRRRPRPRGWPRRAPQPDADDPASWTVDRGLSERCITFGLPNLLAGYNSYYHILQTAEHVVIEQELIHTTRIIPLDGRPHVDGDIRQWHGDSRGYWDGDTLVVETTNFSPQSDFRGSREHLRLVERFTRVGHDDMHYEFTVSDPTTWTDSWTALVPWKRTEDALFEYACHEGNIGMEGILSGARADDAKAAGAR